MYRIQFGSASDRPSLLMFPAKGDLTFTATLTADTPTLLVPAITDNMLQARNLSWIVIYVIQPGTPQTEALLSDYVQPDIPIPPADISNWTAFTPINNWVHNPQLNSTPEQYRRQGDTVSVRFSVQGGTSFVIWTLPEGYRPKYVISKMCQIHDNTNAPDYGHLQIRINGDIYLEHPGTLNNHKAWADFSFSIL